MAALLVRAGSALFPPDEANLSPPVWIDSADRPPLAKRVLIVSIDGLRPDLLLRASIPRLRWLMSQGAFSMWARTTELSNTLPSHTSMLTGVRPEYHRITWNHYIERAYPDAETIFELAHRARPPEDERLTTGLVAGKSKFHELAKPGTIDFLDVFPDKTGSNTEIGSAAADMIRRHVPAVTFVHLPDSDRIGHAIGWGTPQQIRAIERADEAVAMMLDALSARGVLGETVVIVSADHGGQGKSHGPNDPRSRHIPWIVAGPGVRRGYDLAREARLVINTEDTFATACAMMGIPVPGRVDGRFVEEILEPKRGPERELMYAVAQAGDKPDAKKKVEPSKGWRNPPGYKWERQAAPSHHP